MTRPDPPYPLLPGHHWHAEPEVATWRLVGREVRCRARAGRCRSTAVAELNRGQYTNRGRIDVWWPYCAEHLYGRWVEDGKVMAWNQRPNVAAGQP